MRGLPSFVIACAAVGLATPAVAQVGVPLNNPVPVVVQPAPTPTTKLEGFQAPRGVIVTVGHEYLGAIANGRVRVDVRDMRDSQGNAARGATLLLVESATRDERAYLDEDEIPDVLKSFDALLKFTANPTAFKRFESRFTSRGNLSFVAYTNTAGNIEYALQVNKVPLATIGGIDSADMLKLYSLIELALQKLNNAK